MSLLRVDQLSVRYGAVQAVRDASLHLDEGELVVLVGANGAGKTSLLRGISGLNRAQGAIVFEGREMTGKPAEQLVRAGLAHVPEGRHIFGRMTVLENLQAAGWRSRHHWQGELDRIFTLFPVLRDRSGQVAGTLSGGEQQMLAIGRALIKRPRVLMLDEPSMGLAPKLVATVLELIAEINVQGTAVLLVEQNARMALAIAGRAYIMEIGRLSGGGPAKELLDDEQLRAAYFGGRASSPNKIGQSPGAGGQA
jgi:branched-chain amino acid transport system ATP-binding protein